MEPVKIWWVITGRSAWGTGGKWSYFKTEREAKVFHATHDNVHEPARLREGNAVKIDGEIYFPPKKVDFNEG